MEEEEEKELKKWVEERTWEQFVNAGMLWYVNRILHLFGWAIMYDAGKDGSISNMRPARCRFRGFSEESDHNGFKKVYEFIDENFDDFKKDIDI